MTTTYGDPRGELWCRVECRGCLGTGKVTRESVAHGVGEREGESVDVSVSVECWRCSDAHLGQTREEQWCLGQWKPGDVDGDVAAALDGAWITGTGRRLWRASHGGFGASGHASSLHTAMRHAKAALELLREMEAMLGELDPDEPDDRPGRVLTREWLERVMTRERLDRGTIATDGPVHIANMDQAREMLGEGSSFLDLVADQFEHFRAVSEAVRWPTAAIWSLNRKTSAAR